jgi:hypothetical protein
VSFSHPTFLKRVLAIAFVLGAASPALAVEVSKAEGTLTIDGTAFPVSFAVETSKDNLFNEKKRDLVVVLTDQQLRATKPDDEVGLTVKAHRGELVVLALRIDNGTLVNVSVSHKDLQGIVILPGAWFHYTARGRPGVGSLKLPPRDFEGHSYAIDVEFAAAPGARPPVRPAAAPTGSAPAVPSTADRTPR